MALDCQHASSVQTPSYSRTLLIDHFSPSPEGLPRNVHVARSLEDSAALERKECNLLLYFWQPSAKLLAALNSGATPESYHEFASEGISAWIEGAGTALERLLFQELEPYVRQFQAITKSKRIVARLQKTQEQMCPLFHVDHMPLRMIVTLRGAGTEWLDDADVLRKGLGKGRNDKVVRRGALVQQLRCFQIGFMKGQHFRDHFGKGLVHRSPAAADECQTRYLFKLDSGLRS